MYNPFTEAATEDSEDVALVDEAKGGSRDALEKLILRHQAWVYNIAVRMVFSPQDAEDVTQEVLVKAITRLTTFQGNSQFRTWLYRITANHVLNMKRRGPELRPQTFGSYAVALDNTPDLDLPDPKSVPVDVPLLVEEAKLTCTTGMLLCMDRKQRLIFTLGEILGVSDIVGSEILETSIRTTCSSFPFTSSGLGKPQPTRFARSKTSSTDSTPPFIAITRSSNRLTKSTGSGGFSTYRTSARPCTFPEENPPTVVTVPLPPCLRG